MIIDIEGKEISIGDEFYFPYSNILYRAKLVKETSKAIQYKFYNKANEISHGEAYPGGTFYLVKSGNPAKFLLKLC